MTKEEFNPVWDRFTTKWPRLNDTMEKQAWWDRLKHYDYKTVVLPAIQEWHRNIQGQVTIVPDLNDIGGMCARRLAGQVQQRIDEQPMPVISKYRAIALTEGHYNDMLDLQDRILEKEVPVSVHDGMLSMAQILLLTYKREVSEPAMKAYKQKK